MRIISLLLLLYIGLIVLTNGINITEICLVVILSLVLKMILNGDRPNGDKYGMPSGHMLIYFYLFLTIKNLELKYLGLLLIIITAIDKYISKEHSLVQLIVGSLIGISLVIFRTSVNY